MLTKLQGLFKNEPQTSSQGSYSIFSTINGLGPKNMDLYCKCVMMNVPFLAPQQQHLFSLSSIVADGGRKKA